MLRKDSCGVAGDIAMQEGRDRCHEDRNTRRRRRKKGNTLFWNLSYDDLFGGAKKVGAQRAAKRGEAG